MGNTFRSLVAQAAMLAVVRRADMNNFPAIWSNSPCWPRNRFSPARLGHWDAKIRDVAWIIRDADGWHLWYTGYDGAKTGIRRLGYATSPDGLQWKRHPGNPLLADHRIRGYDRRPPRRRLLHVRRGRPMSATADID